MLAFTKRVSIATALTLGVALSMPLSVPAFSDPAPSNTAVQNRAATVCCGVAILSGCVQGDQVDCYWTDPSGQMNAQSFPIHVLQKS